MIIAESKCFGVGTTKISLVVDESTPSLFEKRRIKVSRDIFGGEKTTFTVGIDKSGAENMLRFLKSEFPELFEERDLRNRPLREMARVNEYRRDSEAKEASIPHPEPPEPKLRWYDDVSGL